MTAFFSRIRDLLLSGGSGNVRDRLFLFLAISTVLALAAYRFFLFSIFEPTAWDVYSFLDLSREIASLSASNILWAEGDRPLLLPIITALIMKLGLYDARAIYLAGAGFFAIGSISFYLLLRLKFSAGASFLGLLIFLTNPLVLEESASGMTNLPGVSLSILGIYLMLRAKDKPSLFYFILPVMLLAALTRYTAGLMLLPALLYLLTSEYRVKYNLLRSGLHKGINLTFFLYLPFGLYFYVVIGSFFWPLLLSIHASRSTTSLRASVNHPELDYYILRSPEFISSNTYLGYILAFLAAVMIVLFIVRIVKKLNLLNNILLAMLPVAFLFRSSLVAIVASIPPFFKLLKSREVDQFGNVIFIWFISFFLFHSISIIKMDRYFLSMFPPLLIMAYLLIKELYIVGRKKIPGSMQEFFSEEPRHWIGTALVSITPLVIGALIFLSALPTITSLNEEQHSYDRLGKAIKDSSSSLHLVEERSLASNLYPLHAWYLGRYIDPSSYYLGSSRTNRKEAIEHNLHKKDSKLFLSVFNYKLNGYEKIYQDKLNGLFYYKRDENFKVPDLPRVFYVGNGWQRQIEGQAGYTFYLDYDLKPPSGLGGYRIGRSIYLDNYQQQDLNDYRYLFAFNFKWHDRSRMEELLKEYVSQGGTLVIDTSGNLRSPLSVINLRDRRLLGTNISRVETDRVVDVHTDLTTGGVPEDILSIRLDEPLTGAAYSSNSKNFKAILNIDGETFFAEQRIGKGKVYWIGMDLLRFASRSDQTQLKQLVADILTYVIDDPDRTRTMGLITG